MQFEQIPDLEELVGRIVHEWSPVLSHAGLRIVQTMTYYGYVGNRGLEWRNVGSLAEIAHVKEGYTRRLLGGLTTLGILREWMDGKETFYSVNRSFKAAGHTRMQRQFVRRREPVTA